MIPNQGFREIICIIRWFFKAVKQKEGQAFYADFAKPEGFCDEAWRLSTSMCLHWHMEREMMKKFLTKQ